MVTNARSEAVDDAGNSAMPGGIAIPLKKTQPGPFLDSVSASTPPVPSPAHDLQHHLDARLTGFSFQMHSSAWLGEAGRWSARRTLAFVFVSNSLAWATLVWCAAILAS